MKYLGIDSSRPRIAVFDLTGCQGCELQLANKEETLADFLNAVEVVQFREISSATTTSYDIAFIDGCVSRADEVERLQTIRERAAMVVALGSCACFGGVSRLKNDYDLDAAKREVYGTLKIDTEPVRAVDEVIHVDFKIPGCPVTKDEVERIVQHLVWDVPYHFPSYPVCLECKQRFTVCTFDTGQLCLGSITRAGCGAPCPAAGLGCWGCRGPAVEANIEEFRTMVKERDYADDEVAERLHFFGGFEEAQ
ncbi:MAG: NADH:ubiquinone oxidoreductase [bacterium]|nr:NADH:ubiquinone oxidoreductase [bacterium]